MGGEKVNYTHVMSPYTNRSLRAMGYWKSDPELCSLEPPTYGDYTVTYLYSDYRKNITCISLERTGISINHPATLRYFGCYDTKELYDFGSVVDVVEIPHVFFDSNDSDPQPKVYISTTPPLGCPKPFLSHKITNCHLYREVA